MEVIISASKFDEFAKYLQAGKKKVVLVGGCFDVLHPGHIVFLQKAKEEGDVLVVLLESDQKAKQLKGDDRPFHTQKERAKMLSALEAVDFVILLPFMENSDYDELVSQIKPDVIAATAGYESKYHKKAAKLVGAKLKFVTKKVGNYSTSRILNP